MQALRNRNAGPAGVQGTAPAKGKDPSKLQLHRNPMATARTSPPKRSQASLAPADWASMAGTPGTEWMASLAASGLSMSEPVALQWCELPSDARYSPGDLSFSQLDETSRFAGSKGPAGSKVMAAADIPTFQATSLGGERSSKQRVLMVKGVALTAKKTRHVLHMAKAVAPSVWKQLVEASQPDAADELQRTRVAITGSRAAKLGHVTTQRKRAAFTRAKAPFQPASSRLLVSRREFGQTQSKLSDSSGVQHDSNGSNHTSTTRLSSAPKLRMQSTTSHLQNAQQYCRNDRLAEALRGKRRIRGPSKPTRVKVA